MRGMKNLADGLSIACFPDGGYYRDAMFEAWSDAPGDPIEPVTIENIREFFLREGVLPTLPLDAIQRLVQEFEDSQLRHQ